MNGSAEKREPSAPNKRAGKATEPADASDEARKARRVVILEGKLCQRRAPSKDFPWIQDAVGIHRLLDRPHQCELRWAARVVQELPLERADSMLGRNRAPAPRHDARRPRLRSRWPAPSARSFSPRRGDFRPPRDRSRRVFNCGHREVSSASISPISALISPVGTLTSKPSCGQCGVRCHSPGESRTLHSSVASRPDFATMASFTMPASSASPMTAS